MAGFDVLASKLVRKGKVSENIAKKTQRASPSYEEEWETHGNASNLRCILLLSEKDHSTENVRKVKVSENIAKKTQRASPSFIRKNGKRTPRIADW